MCEGSSVPQFHSPSPAAWRGSDDTDTHRRLSRWAARDWVRLALPRAAARPYLADMSETLGQPMGTVLLALPVLCVSDATQPPPSSCPLVSPRRGSPWAPPGEGEWPGLVWMQAIGEGFSLGRMYRVGVGATGRYPVPSAAQLRGRVGLDPMLGMGGFSL